MSAISSVFEKPGYVAMIPYVTIGYPSVEATLQVAKLLTEHGSDIIELGIPFSDPLADGVTIQRASFRALQNGVTPGMCLELAKDLRQTVSTPLVFMTYFNPVLTYGLKQFCRDCVLSGVNGLIVPDLPPDEGSELEKATRDQGLDLIYLLAPTSTEHRIRLVAEHSRGFTYLVSVTGVTGVRDKLPSDLETFVSRVRKVTLSPLCIGFGISTPEQARLAAQLSDGVIVGSKIIQLLEIDDGFASLVAFLTDLRNAVDQVAKAREPTD